VQKYAVESLNVIMQLWTSILSEQQAMAMYCVALSQTTPDVDQEACKYYLLLWQ